MKGIAIGTLTFALASAWGCRPRAGGSNELRGLENEKVFPSENYMNYTSLPSSYFIAVPEENPHSICRAVCTAGARGREELEGTGSETTCFDAKLLKIEELGTAKGFWSNVGDKQKAILDKKYDEILKKILAPGDFARITTGIVYPYDPDFLEPVVLDAFEMLFNKSAVDCKLSAEVLKGKGVSSKDFIPKSEADRLDREVIVPVKGNRAYVNGRENEVFRIEEVNSEYVKVSRSLGKDQWAVPEIVSRKATKAETEAYAGLKRGDQVRFLPGQSKFFCKVEAVTADLALCHWYNQDGTDTYGVDWKPLNLLDRRVDCSTHSLKIGQQIVLPDTSYWNWAWGSSSPGTADVLECNKRFVWVQLTKDGVSHREWKDPAMLKP